MPKNIASTRIEVKKSLSAAQRREVAQDIIDYIRDRTAQGKGKSGRPWGGKASQYSKSYGKNPPVDLVLSGDMLNSLQLLANKPGEITIGVPLGDKDWGKAKGNILGTYGKKSPIPGKARRFLDISRNEVKAVMS